MLAGFGWNSLCRLPHPLCIISLCSINAVLCSLEFAWKGKALCWFSVLILFMPPSSAVPLTDRHSNKLSGSDFVGRKDLLGFSRKPNVESVESYTPSYDDGSRTGFITAWLWYIAVSIYRKDNCLLACFRNVSFNSGHALISRCQSFGQLWAWLMSCIALALHESCYFPLQLGDDCHECHRCKRKPR